MLKRGREEEKGRRQRAERLSEGYSVVAEKGTGTWMKGVTALREETKRSSPEKKEEGGEREVVVVVVVVVLACLCARCRVSHSH